MVFMQILVSYESVQYKRSGHLHFCSMEVCMGKLELSVTSAYIECETGKGITRYAIELADSFLLNYRYWTFAKITASALWKRFWTSGIATSGTTYANCTDVPKTVLNNNKVHWLYEFNFISSSNIWVSPVIIPSPANAKCTLFPWSTWNCYTRLADSCKLSLLLISNCFHVH